MLFICQGKYRILFYQDKKSPNTVVLLKGKNHVVLTDNEPFVLVLWQCLNKHTPITQGNLWQCLSEQTLLIQGSYGNAFVSKYS